MNIDMIDIIPLKSSKVQTLKIKLVATWVEEQMERRKWFEYEERSYTFYYHRLPLYKRRKISCEKQIDHGGMMHIKQSTTIRNGYMTIMFHNFGHNVLEVKVL